MKNAWPTKSLDDIFDIARGGSPRPIDEFYTDSDDGVNWIMIGDTTEGSKYIEGTRRKIDPSGVGRSREVNPGDFLLTNSMSFGRPYILKISGCIHDGWLVLSPKNGAAHPDYFYYLLASDAIYSEFSRLAAGATVKNLNIDLVKTVKVALPPIADQKRIAAILDAADALRQKRRQALRVLDQLAQSIFIEMFGDPVANERNWPVKAIGRVTSKIGSGATPTGGEASYKPEGIALIRSMNVRDGHFEFDGLAYLDDAQAARLDNVIVEADDILLNITGASVARVCRAPTELAGSRVNQHVSIVRPTDEARPCFVESALLHPSNKRKLLQIAEAGATRQAITKSQIEDFPLILPPPKEQRDFERNLSKALLLRRLSVEQATSMQALFQSLQHRAFLGEL